MSYILDALQKSEQQRKNQAPPELTASQGRTPPPRRWPLWLALASTLLLLNAGGAWLWLQAYPGSDINTAISASPTPVMPAAAGRIPLGLERGPAPRPLPAASPGALATVPAAPPPVTASLDPIAPAPLFAPVTSKQAPAAQPISKLPRDIQRQIPDLAISSHLYSDDFRLVNINGRMMREGEYIGTELKLEEITEDGVIISFQTYRMTLRVIQDWAYEP